MAKRILLGKEGSNYVLKVSKPTVDVIDDSINARDYLFNSEMYRAGVIRSNSTYTTMTTAGVDLPTTSDANGTAYIPAFIISEKGAFYPQGEFDQAFGSGGSAFGALYVKVVNCLSTEAGGGLYQFSLNASGTTKNKVIPYYVNLDGLTDPRPGENDGTYPYFSARSRSSSDGDVKIQILGIPCQFGKMTNNATLFGNSVLTGTNTGEGGSSGGGSVSAPTISSISRSARNNTNDTVTVNASNGTNNSGTITYAQGSSNSASGLTFQSSSSFTQPRNSTRYYFARQGGLTSTTSGSNHVYTSAAVDTTPTGFSFTNVSVGASTSTSASYTVAGLGDGDTASVSTNNGSLNTSSVQNGDTVTITLTSSATGGGTVSATVTLGTASTTWTVTTTTSNNPQFSPADFTDATGQELSATVDSNTLTVSNINVSLSVTTSGCSVSINGGGFQNSGSVSNGGTLRIRSTSSSSYGTTTTPSITVGSQTINQSVTTRNATTASAPTSITATQSTNTNDASQTITLSASGGSGTLQFSNDGSNWGTGTTFSHTRNTTVTYYARRTAEAGPSSAIQETFFVPPVFDLGDYANLASASAGGGSVSRTISTTGSGSIFNFSSNSSTYGTYTISASVTTNPGSMLSNVAVSQSTGTVTATMASNTGSARTAVITVSVSTSKGGSDSDTFNVPQNAASTSLWEVGLTQATATVFGNTYHGYNNTGLNVSFPLGSTTDSSCDLFSGTPQWGFYDIEGTTNTLFTVQSSISNTGWTTLKIYSGTSASGTLQATLSRTSLTFTSAGFSGVANWNLGADYTSGSGSLYLVFS